LEDSEGGCKGDKEVSGEQSLVVRHFEEVAGGLIDLSIAQSTKNLFIRPEEIYSLLCGGRLIYVTIIGTCCISIRGVLK